MGSSRDPGLCLAPKRRNMRPPIRFGQLASGHRTGKLTREGIYTGVFRMRSRFASLVIGVGLMVAAAAPALACAYHDRQASAQDQQQTADAQPGSKTTTQ